MNGWVKGRMHEWIKYGWVKGRMNEWKDGWKKGKIYV